MSVDLDRWILRAATISLIGISAAYRSPAFAVVGILALGLYLAREVAVQYAALKEVKPTVSEEVRRAIQDINARVATLEYGVKTRGF